MAYYMIFAVHGHANKHEDALRIANELHLPRRRWKLYPGQPRDWLGYRRDDVIHVYSWTTRDDLLKQIIEWVEKH